MTVEHPTDPAALATVIYLHGFRSSKASIKARELASYMALKGPELTFWCEDLPISPKAAIRKIEEILKVAGSKALLVGSSLGGYYATYLAERHGRSAVLINPACRAAELLAPWVGLHQNLYSGLEFELTPQHIEELNDLFVQRLTDPGRFRVFLETGDEVLDYREAVERYAGARITVIEGGSHGLESFKDHLPEILSLARSL
jgi:predicted esterase YcpF (UPF0227 family)